MGYQIYLRKGDQSFGPFNEQEVDRMRANGELNKYEWIHDGSDWKQLAAPPPPPPAPTAHADPVAAVEPIRRSVAPQPKAYETTTEEIEPKHPIEAICYDYRNVVPGTLHRITNSGCELVTRDPHQSPCFAKETTVYLNLLDSKTGKSMDVAGRLANISGQNGNWTYRIEWERCPELIR